jgi:hypothetical protein
MLVVGINFGQPEKGDLRLSPRQQNIQSFDAGYFIHSMTATTRRIVCILTTRCGDHVVSPSKQQP